MAVIWGVGCIAVVAVSMATIATSIGWISDALAKWRTRSDEKTRQLAASDLGNDMVVNSWWFSEDEPTRVLMTAIGNSLMRSRCCSFDPNKIRDEWRKVKDADVQADTNKDKNHE